jgi:hypothetical protein
VRAGFWVGVEISPANLHTNELGVERQLKGRVSPFCHMRLRAPNARLRKKPAALTAEPHRSESASDRMIILSRK